MTVLHGITAGCMNEVASLSVIVLARALTEGAERIRAGIADLVIRMSTALYPGYVQRTLLWAKPAMNDTFPGIESGSTMSAIE